MAHMLAHRILGSRKDAMSLPVLGGEGEECGLQGAHKGLYQTSQGAPGGRIVVPYPGHGAQLGSWVLLSFWSRTGVQGLWGGKGSEVPPCPLTSAQGCSSGPAQGECWRGWCLGQGHRGGTWEAGSGHSCGQQGCKKSSELALALAPQSSEGHAGPNPPAAVLGVTSCLLGCSRVGVAQKMLCRRLFPRPGAEGKRRTVGRRLGQRVPEIRRDGYTPELPMQRARACAQEPVSPGFKSHLCHLGAA